MCPNDSAGIEIDAYLAVDQEQLEQTSEHFQPNISVNNSFTVLNLEETNLEIVKPSISEHTNQQHDIQMKNVPTSKQLDRQMKQASKWHKKQRKGKYGHNMKDKQEIPQNDQ